MRALRIDPLLAIGALVMLPGTPGAQEPSAQDLINRIRQIQAEQQAAPQPSEQPAPAAQGQSAQDLIDRIRQIQGEQQAAPQPSEQPEPAAMQPDLSEDEIRTIVGESLGVEILRVEVVEQDGRPAYAITVMNPPGNRNDAYRVATLLFDGATGSLLGQKSPAPRSAAADLSTATTPSGFEGSGPEIRRRTWR